MLWGKRRDSCKIVASINLQLTELRMQKPRDNSKASPAAFMQDNTLIAVIELSLSNWLVAGLIPGVSREPLKKLEPNPEDLLKLLHGWRDEAIKAGRPITRIAVAYETGRFLLKLYADGGYQGPIFQSAVRKILRQIDVEIVKRSDIAKGFAVLPKRWIVERTIAWLNRCRRLAKDWECLNRKALAFLRLASIRLMLRKLCQKRA